jgi:hypothetical protein
MKADLTRNTFNPLKHFVRVLMQQGRVQLDSDWNEQAAILLRYLQTLAADLIGPGGGPGAVGFALGTLPVSNDFRIGLGRYYVDGILCEADAEAAPVGVPSDGSANLQVRQWTLDGIPFAPEQLVEIFDDVSQPFASPGFPAKVAQITKVNQAKALLTLDPLVDISSGINPSIRRALTYLTQPDLPAPDPLDQTQGGEGAYLAYLDVWERHLTYIEDNSIREVALGGPDTATRSKLVWQVKVVKGEVADTNKPCDKFKPDDDQLLAHLFGPDHGHLKARAQRKSTVSDPCVISPDANFHGPENQLYRVEIHKAGSAWDDSGIVGRASAGTRDAATFKWSRENGSVTFPIVGPISTGDGLTTLSLANLGRDDRFGLAEGDWTEIQDDDYVLRNRAGNLLQVQSIDRSSMRVTLTGTPDTNVGNDQSKHPLLRRWDHKQGDPAEGGTTLGPDGAPLVQESDEMWLDLEDGVQIQFQPAPAGRANQYRTGDYWLIPARTTTADVEWPTETVKDNQGNIKITALARPPQGIVHHYAPLGAFTVADNGTITLIPDEKNETCRKSFAPVTV